MEMHSGSGAGLIIDSVEKIAQVRSRLDNVFSYVKEADGFYIDGSLRFERLPD